MRDGEGESRKRKMEWKIGRVTVRERVFFHLEGKCFLIICVCVKLMHDVHVHVCYI